MTLSRYSSALLLVYVSAPCLANDPFTIVALPDTQNYVNSTANAPLFTQQTQWIADQIQIDGNPRNIQFVTHLGDMVSSGDNLTQMIRADASMDVLDGVVPYSVLPGNHDYADTGVKSTGTDLYLTYFGPERFEGESWFGGADPSGNNSYQRFQAGGYEFIHMALEWQPNVNSPFREVSPISWAQSVLDANPDTPVILSTHEHIDDSPAGRSGSGDAVWDQLISHNDQIFMVLNGHYHSVGGSNDGEYHQISMNNADRPVIEVLQDYQDYPNGGDGWLRLIHFDIPNNTIGFETYSPVLDQYQTETVESVGQFASQFEIAIDFANRLDPVFIPDPPEPPKPDFTFQQGVGGYNGTHDKELRSSGGDAANGQDESMSIDGDDGSPGLQPNHGLIRFDDIIGENQAQLSVDTEIERALLVVEVTSQGTGFSVHDMLVDWDENDTWASFGAGVQVNDIEAVSIPVATLGSDNGAANVSTGRLEIDVTTSIRAYQQGTLDNHGWALIPFLNGTDGIDFFTSEAADPSLRPSLQIFLAGLPGDANGDGAVDILDLDILSGNFGLASGATIAQGDFNDDGGVDILDLDILSANFGAARSAAIPEPSSALLAAATTIFAGIRSRNR